MNFERKKDPKESLNIGKISQIKQIRGIYTKFKEKPKNGFLGYEQTSLISDVHYFLGTFIKTAEYRKSEHKDKTTYVIFSNIDTSAGDSMMLDLLWGEWVEIDGKKYKIPEKLKPDGVERMK